MSSASAVRDVKEKGCIEECPVDCIYEGQEIVYIHPDECVDCGACEPVCPVEAIYYEDDVPRSGASIHGERRVFDDWDHRAEPRSWAVERTCR